MKIALIINTMKQETEEYKEIVLRELEKRGISVTLIPEMDYSRGVFDGSDFIITLGGDGTILRTAGVLSGLTIPILGMNTGHLGYLTEVSRKEEIATAIDALVRGDYYRDNRSMLTAKIYRDGRPIGEGLALNEILITRAKGISILRLRVFCDGEALTSYAADGIIVSSPTGSTAYNLSAGGPIVSPTAPVYIMTPICAHTLNDRSVILDDDKRVEILVESEQQIVAFDGENIQELQVGDRICIEKAVAKTVLIKLSKASFLQTLREKMV